ncbi:polysaccharide pyruvyl transferase family protein [Bacteroides reticulotermitis]|uniref:Polysaccharide pyruvyl transferase domain-containing protein n=2 Tax=Bacteroides reticulotermitis TaxID=1133319 RepID=W4UUL5_9BACE|nr:polysaccharide pyruvyl transferase family protein [Bacteroides reticulotermitis]MBB4045538.1 polysaccharide pyruvyl transferase WcaK-like protein [Bacteroides reticulotermitis]GAE84492.1 hypothetical protein JCM10512_2837 [Bacteroides reticulotermitis JCM 10512]
MKIGILTYYGDLNCGTNLQAYATMLAIRRKFPLALVEIIDFHGFKQDIKPYKTDMTLATLYNDAARILKYRRFVRRRLEVSREYIIRDVQKALDHIQSKQYDCIYVGADTLLELDRLPNTYDGLSSYWLSSQVLANKYLLAASAKNVSYELLSEIQKKKMRDTILSYSGISVRDMATMRLISHFIPKEKIDLIADPTFTLDIDYNHVESYIRSKKKYDFDQPIIGFHTLKDDLWAKEVAFQLKNKGYKIASLRPAHWADYILNDMSPLEQLGIYKYFKCMITHRFHDSIFAIINNTPVVNYSPDLTFANNKGESKHEDLLKLFGLKDSCFIENRTQMTAVAIIEKIISSIDYFTSHLLEIQEKRIQLREEYYNFLDKTISS